MACELALALYKFGDVARGLGIVEVEHIGSHNCRRIAGSTDLSMHGLGLAFDFGAFAKADGTTFDLERDWEHDTANPSTTKAQVLYDIALRMHQEHLSTTCSPRTSTPPMTTTSTI